MNKWIKSLFAAAVTTGLVILFYKKSLSSQKPILCKVHYVLSNRHDQDSDQDKLGEIPATIKENINRLGYFSILRITKDNDLDILVENVRDTAVLRRAVQQNIQNKKIGFREIYTLNELPAFFSAANNVADKIFATVKRKDEGIYSILSPLAPDEIDGDEVYPPAIGAINKKDTAVLNRILHEPKVLNAIPEDVQFSFGKLTDENQLLNTPDDLHLYAIRTRDETAIHNDDIESAEAVHDNYNGTGITIKFDNTGTAKWAKLTSENVGRYLAITLDDLVVSTPRVYSPVTGGWATFSFLHAEIDASGLAKQLTTKRSPAELAIIKEEIFPKNTGSHGNLLLILSLTFVIAGGIAFLIFNSLKNK